jgi:hypothetical protein
MKLSKLNIPKPCSENWNAMHSTNEGKFCNLCSKQVIDFTVLTDTQIIQYFEQQQGKTCGRLTQEQIERINLLLQKQENEQPNLWRIFAWALSASTLTSTAILQEAKAENIVYQEVTNKKPFTQLINTTTNDTIKEFVITGKVISVEDGTALPGVTVSIKGSKIGTQTDIEGAYKLDISEFTNQPEVIIVFSFIGMKTQEHKVNLQDSVCDVGLKIDENLLNGEVVVVGGIHYNNVFQRTWWKAKYFFRKLFGAY